MEEMKRGSHAPLIVTIVILLLPVLYVASYFALVEPDGVWVRRLYPNGNRHWEHSQDQYRMCEYWSERFYWPMELIDRRLRPQTWGQFPSDMRNAKDMPLTASGGKSAVHKWSE